MRRALASLAVASLLIAAPARAAEPAARDDARVPLTANFPAWELAGIGGVFGWYAALSLLQGPITRASIGSTTAPTCAGCAIGPPGALDRAISDALYRGPDAGPFLARFPDHLGMAIGPAVAGTFYVTDAILQWTSGRGVTGNRSADHELFALAEAFFLAMSVNQTVKITTGRLRPYYEFDRGPSLPPPPDTNLAFFSGHATASFTLASFISRDVGDWLVTRPLRAWDPAPRALVGRALPAIGFYGAATVVALSRVIDQAHYFSDVAVGAGVGALIGNVVYALHFDGSGRPRDHRESPVALRLVPFPGGIGLAGQY